MHEAHYASYAMHPRSTKMYRDLRSYYWRPIMKKDVAEFVARCLTCQQVKVEHQAPTGKLHPLSIPEWKWEKITMDFVIGLPRKLPKGFRNEIVFQYGVFILRQMDSQKERFGH
ncbi:UNVERIFIED_CONTAM: hypothetical protein Scaly_2564300 [Sesamum calycinum]|uniref:Integrase zinc-binding domain-containing protein n=1 Tax=Sesamum calycinum TaxID=2727403 RepID=A0AAW2K6E7_9LAMI